MFVTVKSRSPVSEYRTAALASACLLDTLLPGNGFKMEISAAVALQCSGMANTHLLSISFNYAWSWQMSSNGGVFGPSLSALVSPASH